MESLTSNVYNIWTDGSCFGNPGPGGWSYIVEHRGVEREHSGAETKTSNNRMEVQAALAAILSCPDNAKIVINSDSQYLVKSMNDWMPKWLLSGFKHIKNLDLWVRMNEACKTRHVEFRWVRAHNVDKMNIRVDALARKAMRQLLEEPDVIRE